VGYPVSFNPSPIRRVRGDLVEIEELKARHLNKEFDVKEFPVRAEAMVDFATSVGETAAYYVDPAHPDFRAVPTFPARFHGRRMLPEDFPKLGLPLDGGKAVMPQAPIRAGVTLIGKSHLHEIYEKTGRTGRMIFLVSRMEVFDPSGALVSIVDSRHVIRERPKAET
jgi:hypothetical protein